MNPPGKTTLSRMQIAAHNEAERIEISQDSRVLIKMLDAPMPSQVALRDDFAGIVRLIDIIMSDKLLLERLQARMSEQGAARAAAVPDAADVEMDAEELAS